MESSTRIFEALSDRYDWTFVTTRETHFNPRWRDSGAQVAVCPFDEQADRLRRGAAYLAWSSSIFRCIASRGIDLIHANDTRAFNAASLPALLLRKPLVMTVRDTKGAGEPYGRVWRQAARQCRNIITLSSEMGEVMAENIGAAPSKLRTINSIVDLVRFAPPTPDGRRAARAALGIAEGEFAIGCIGVIRDKKNQRELIERALPEVVAQAPSSRIHFFGDFKPERDRYTAECAAAVSRMGLSNNVVFHGHLSDMAGTIKALDAIVIGARHEGLARAMIEGMACAVPVVSFAVCSAREMLAATGSGIVVPMGDYGGLAAALVRLALEPEMRTAIGIRGRRTAEERFNMQRISNDYLALYEEVLSHAC